MPVAFDTEMKISEMQYSHKPCFGDPPIKNPDDAGQDICGFPAKQRETALFPV